MKERITIKNFGGIKEVSIELKGINLLIGPQASGKSIIAKLLYYFKKSIYFFTEIRNGDFEIAMSSKFKEFFPEHTWPSDDFSIQYINDDMSLEVHKINANDNDLTIVISGKIKDIISEHLNRLNEYSKSEDKSSLYISNTFSQQLNDLISRVVSTYSYFGLSQFFIPAGRAFFSLIQARPFTLYHRDTTLDPFFVEFGSFFEQTKDIYASFNNYYNKPINDLSHQWQDLLCGIYQKDKDKEFILHNDGRRVGLSHLSSGQQETLPLLMILQIMSSIPLPQAGTTIYIEEPEAHIYPSSQKIITELIAYAYNSSASPIQFIITTHSPYILTSLNNLMFAGSIKENCDDSKKKKLYEILPENKIIDPSEVCAYSVENGEAKSIIDPETRIISQTILDSVSDETAKTFDSLLDLL